MMQTLSMIWIAIDFWALGVWALFALFCIVLYRLDKAKDIEFKFHDFFSSGDWNGKASVTRLGYFGAFLTHSFVIFHQEMKQGASDAILWPYALIWSGAYVAAKLVETKVAPPPPPPIQSQGVTNETNQP